MDKHSRITLDRCRQFLNRELRDKLVLASSPVSAELLVQEDPRATPHEADVRKAKGWRKIEPGEEWGPAYAVGWYRLRGTAPADWDGKTLVLAYGEPRLGEDLPNMVEGTLWIDGQPSLGLDHGHPYARLGRRLRAGESLDWVMQVHAHNRETTVHHPEKPRSPKPERFEGFCLAAIDEDLIGLALDVAYGIDLAAALPETDPSHAALVRALNDVCNRFEGPGTDSVRRCRRLLSATFGNVGGEPRHTVTPVGHAHLDTAWLWPLHVTHLKMVHTTTVQLELMERYPEHVFVHSQASQYEWLEKDYPVLLERIKAAITRGQWEPLGSMWVEADCNLTGSESLVRQFLYGRRWFEQKLGVTTDDMWLPDVFGYSAALPQILNKFGIKYFLTQKLSWNQFNKPPHHTFWWQGIDGSRIWTHFPPADTYNASATPSELIRSVQAYKDHARCDRSLLVFGYGDGGGGPTERHLEFLRRMRETSNLPEVEKGKGAKDFFREAYAASNDLMTWVGELYFEMHRGTYTTQAANKKGNRESEFLLRDAEWLSCFCDGFPAKYPADELEALWKLVLLNQFHDIIPGSSVREVYEDSARDYAAIREGGERIVRESLTRIGSRLDRSGMRRPVALFHNATMPGEGAIDWPEAEVPKSLTVGEDVVPVQLVEQFGERKLIFQTPHEALGAVCVGDLSETPALGRPRLKTSARKLENHELALRFDSHGNITSLRTLDETPIEFIEPGALANVFQVFDDKPLFWDAWDTDIFAQETAKDLIKSDRFELVEKGPVRVAFELEKTFGNSRIRQRISLGPTPGVRFDTEIDWHEDRKMLKVAFPLNVNAQRATFEIQFGHVERPTHRNTSWDLARFEVCAQKWADLSEGGHGAALLNDGKYGHDVLGNVMRLTLLRSPKAPDPIADMGRHRFTYVLYPHFDQVQHSDVVAAAYGLNAPLRYAFLQPGPGESGELPPFVHCDNRNVVVESVKKSEDGERIVVRVYECHNTRGPASLVCARPVKRAWLADLAERPLQGLDVMDDAVPFDIKPFEIVTLLLEV